MNKSSKIIDKLSSVSLTIFLCIFLALVSLIGTLIPQDLPIEGYRELYGNGVARVVSAIGLADIYHSAGFIFLLCFLAVNLVACTGKRFPGVWRSLRREHTAPSDTEFKGWRYTETYVLGLRPESLGNQLEQAVSKALGRGARKTLSGPGTQIFCLERNRTARLGPYIAHISILLILAGGMVGAIFGFKGTIILPEGEEASSVLLRKGNEQIPLGFTIRCKRFVIEHYGNEATDKDDKTPLMFRKAVKEYRSEVSLLNEQGVLIKDANIRVNHPIRFKGVNFYQSTYGNLFDVRLRVKDTVKGVESDVQTGLNTPFPLPGGLGDRGVVLDFQEGLRIPAEMMRVTRFSKQNLGPAVRLGVLIKDKGFEEPFWVLKDHPALEEKRKGSYRFVFVGYESVPYTGLQVTHDPGTPLVWTGCILLIVGFLVAFFLDHEILYVTSAPMGDNELVVRFAGRALRHPGVYAGRFEKQKGKMRDALSPWLRPGQTSDEKQKNTPFSATLS